MSNPKDVNLTRNLIHRYNMATESIRQIILPEKDKKKRLYFLESIEKENQEQKDPWLEKYYELENRELKFEKKLEKAHETLIQLIKEVKEES